MSGITIIRILKQYLLSIVTCINFNRLISVNRNYNVLTVNLQESSKYSYLSISLRILGLTLFISILVFPFSLKFFISPICLYVNLDNYSRYFHLLRLIETGPTTLNFTTFHREGKKNNFVSFVEGKRQTFEYLYVH